MYKLLLISFLIINSVNLSDVSYYEILGISKQASTQEIRQAYKKLAIKLHPDKTSNTDEQEKFIKITEAYETLKDPEKRQKYDLYGSFPSYTRKYDYHSQSEYNNLFYNGLYKDDSFVDTLSGQTFYSYLNEGFHFINFYSPFCPPCQNLVEHWKKLAEMYKGIVKVGAVNCKYHNSFCYNSMRIGSYPSLLFYPNGKHGNFIYYRGERTLEHLDKFVMAYLNSRVHVAVVSQILNSNKPIAYVLGANRIERGALTRISYHLKGLVTLVIVEDDNLRTKLTDDDYTTVVFKYKEIKKEIKNIEENDVVKEIVEALPKIESIGPEKLKDIRNRLRQGAKSPWVLYFSTKGTDRLLLHQMTNIFPNINFAEIDCDKWGELCSSLHVEEPPAWGVLKTGGTYQLAHGTDVKTFIPTAIQATNLHTLSASDLQRILEGDASMWVLAVVPYKLSWEHIADPFMKAALNFIDSNDINFGIMTCTLNTDKYCRQLAQNEPAIVIQENRKRHYYDGRIEEDQLTEFIQLLLDSEDLELDEQQVLEISDPSSRQHTWLVAYLPADCGVTCSHLAHQWRLVANKLRPLEFIRVGILECSHHSHGFCTNVRSPTARLYPLASGQHFTVSLQHLSEAPYILEWALSHIDEIQKLNWNLFSKSVAAEELNPSSNRKPWLVYFHSPRCYHCYEMYADFAMASILLRNAVEVGKVNCISDRGLCQHEHITGYPSLRLYLHRNKHQTFSRVITLQLKDYDALLRDIEAYLTQYDDTLLNSIDFDVRNQGFNIKHDEF
ncbi:unnamed protein product [Diatraea saccharalis]|uniref:DnaJ homolog subfamily C member 10 n=1 Tax=Diatraea saccharalis TaxID=40085 RepID=A0A9P0G0Y7_9NEOP|nr:unnamed protein product [Diatraea saccharalis]